MTNAHSARDWLLSAAHDQAQSPGISLLFRPTWRRSTQFGIDTANMFEFWDWVGGRYSLWSCDWPFDCPLVGMDRFEELWLGAPG